MRRKTKIIIILVLLFTFIDGIVYFAGHINEKQRIEVALNSHLTKIQTHYNVLLHHQRVAADAAYRSTIAIKEVIEILSKAEYATKKQRDILREQLFQRLKDKYKILQSKGILQYHFVFPDNIVFLRMHKPSKFGDDLSGIRYSFAHTNKTHQEVHGFEQGKTTHGFRNVYPIYDKNKHYLGSIDIAFSSGFLQDYLINVSKIHTHFLVNKKVFNVKAWQRDDMILKYTQSIEHPDYMVSLIHGTTNKEHILEDIDERVKTKIYHKMNENRKFSLNTHNKNRSVVISFYPIQNIKDKKTVAWIVSYDNDDFIDMTLKMNLYVQVIAFFVFLVLFYFAYCLLNQKEILNIQVKRKTAELADSERKLKHLNENLKITVENEVKKNQEKDRLLFQQSKMASMGEMIGNIAHQWRQPIAVISMWANNIIVDVEMGEIDDESFKKYAHNINEQTKHLSQTIDDFRNFFTPTKEKTTFMIENSLDKTMNLLLASFKTHNIEIIKEIEDTELNAFENELTQAILNILKNAKDILITLNKESKKLIFINIYKKSHYAVIEIIDNGGGVSDDIIDKIFEPYFTTKHKSQGTGIGLYMTEAIITKHLNGEISVENYSYEYKNENYTGAKFIIQLPL